MLKKKILPLVLTLVIILNCGFYANAANDNDIARATRVLLQSGWTQEDIDDLLTEEALLEFANTEEALSQEKYYRVKDDTEVEEISEEQCEQEIAQIDMIENIGGSVSPLSTIPVGTTTEISGGTSYVKLNLYAYNAGYNADGVREYVLSARFEWLKSPVNREKDVFGLGHSTNLDQKGNQNDVYYVFKANRTQVDSINHTTIKMSEYVTHTPTAIDVNTYGTAITQQLCGDVVNEPGVSLLYTNQKGYLQYRAVVNNAGHVSVSICEQYYHRKSLFNGSITASFKGDLTISISKASEYERITGNPYLQFEV